MKVRTPLLSVSALVVVLALPALAEILQQPDTAGQAPPTAPTGTQTTTLPAQSEQTQGSAPLRVMVGKSLLINTTERLRRISVTDDAVAFARVITPTQILVHGRAPGEVSLLIWDELERSRSFDLRVDVDVSACAEEEHRVFPDEQITVTPSRSAVVLSGHVSTEDVAKRAGDLASAYSKNVVNVLTTCATRARVSSTPRRSSSKTVPIPSACRCRPARFRISTSSSRATSSARSRRS